MLVWSLKVILILAKNQDRNGEHIKKSARPSNKGRHQKRRAQKGADRGGEKGDINSRPPNYKSPWPALLRFLIHSGKSLIGIIEIS